ncbi:MAG TPA: efflux RND transporter periplasmic adaptor subunit, partial [Sphingomonadaceae bacterium]|nr:efflux RND transporter periplasmic adaptor subunit [Sphingomonadaceae bacterium]
FVSRADIELKTATRDAARARVRLARAQYQEMRARVGRLDVRAPAAGLVLSRAVEPGQIVGAASPALFTIAKDGEMELKARLAEQDLATMRVGMTATVTPVGSERRFAGRIWQVAPIIDTQSRQGIARIAIPYDAALRPGGFATAEIASGTINAPELPESAVLSDAKGHYVFVIGSGDKVARRDVATGAVSATGIAILSGLEGDERVVLLAGAFLNPGDKVTPARASRPAG